jgi:hypothetical protein
MPHAPLRQGNACLCTLGQVQQSTDHLLIGRACLPWASQARKLEKHSGTSRLWALPCMPPDAHAQRPEPLPLPSA